MEEKNIINIQDEKYPELLRKIGREAPRRLYSKGEWDSEIFKNCLAVVGSRKLTNYGRKITEQLVAEIAAVGVTIVSGFMYGGDEAAHKATIEVGGRTIAVLPCGINIIHPEYQEELYNEILKNKGLIISEFEGNFPPANWTYPKRNRIVAGLSKAILIVEAGLNSGTLITAGFAKKFNRKIFAVPGPLTSEVSRGTAQLLREGAEVVTGSADILKYYDMSLAKPNLAKPSFPQLGAIELEIINQLRKEPMEVDVLAREMKMSVVKLSVSLSLMQLKGLINQEGEKYYVN
jgi:DNA processing protein